MSIIAKNINKSFKTFHKNESFKSTIYSIFRRDYLEKKVLNDISLTINDGEILGLIGPNGSGKTTLIKILSGIIVPDSGTVFVDGENPHNKSKRYRSLVSLIMGQKSKLDLDLTILDSLQLYSTFYSLSWDEIKDNSLELAFSLGLNYNDLSKQVRSLSFGQRMKGDIVLSFMHSPKLIFLDEPTIGLDYETQKKIRMFIKEYCKKNNASAILTSHYITDIQELSDNVLLINEGNNVFYGTISELRNKLPKKHILKIDCKDPNKVLLIFNEMQTLDVVQKGTQLLIDFPIEELNSIYNVLMNNEFVFHISFVEDDLNVIIERILNNV